VPPYRRPGSCGTTGRRSVASHDAHGLEKRLRPTAAGLSRLPLAGTSRTPRASAVTPSDGEPRTRPAPLRPRLSSGVPSRALSDGPAGLLDELPHAACEARACGRRSRPNPAGGRRPKPYDFRPLALLESSGKSMGTSVEKIDRTYGHLVPDSIDRARTALEMFGHLAATEKGRGMERS